MAAEFQHAQSESDSRAHTISGALHSLSIDALDRAAQPIMDKRAMELPQEFNGAARDIEIVDRSLAASMKAAEGMLSNEQIARVNAQAAVPYKYIMMAGIKARPGDTYWGIAQDVVSQRTGRPANKVEVTAMVEEMASLNGKTMKQADHLRVGETVKIPLIDKPQ